MLADHDEHHRYGDATILEPIAEQQDDEHPFLADEQRAREEIEHFEALEKEFASPRHGIRVKFAYSPDEPLVPIGQTTVVKSEPFFHLQASEDQITKHFYRNEFVPGEQPSPDSLEDESIDRANARLSPPGKSILKKVPVSRSPSPSSSKKKLQSNEFSYLAEMTGQQQNSSFERCSVRSLFEPTINIFDSEPMVEGRLRRRPSRLRYYIKPYRGEANLPPEKTSEQRSRSLSNPFARPTTEHANRKQHVSWSPVRAYIHQGREKSNRSATRKKESPMEKNSALLAGRSSSNPCLPSTKSVPIRPRPSRFPSSTPLSQFGEYEEKSSSTSLHVPLQPSKEHTQTMQRYDRLLEKMRTTDEQLQTLSRSWNSKATRLSSMKSTFTRKKTTKPGATDEPLVSPMLLQICLVILVIFNLLVVYFFNDIHFWWSEYTGIVEQREGPTSTYS